MNRPIRVAHVATVDLTVRYLLLGQLRRLRDEGFDVTAICAPGPWAATLEAEEGIPHVPWPHATRAWDPASDAVAFRELLSIFRRERFDLVHTHTPKPGVMGRIAARMAGVPVVVNTVHGLYATPEDPRTKRAVVGGIELLAARFSDLELFQSEEDLVWARRVGLVPRGRSAWLGNGADLTRFDPGRVDPRRVASKRGELGASNGDLVVGTVGRLVAEKGHREFFDAARRVRERIPGARFVAVGDRDPAKPDAISAGEIERAGRHVAFTGWREDVPELLAAMDVFVLASRREGMPRSAIEAAAMGKPLVLTYIRGCREVARHGIEGLLVPPGDPGALAEAIERLLRDPDLRMGLGRAARARALERFDERRVADAVVAWYRELLAAKGLDGARPAATAGGVRIRAARPRDAPVLARLHAEGLPDAFLPALGEPFLRRLYRTMVADLRAVVLVAEDGSGVLGFVAGTGSVAGLYRRFLLRRGMPAVLSAAPRLVRPSVLRRAIETAAYPVRAPGLPAAELLSIAVGPGGRGRGVGRALARELLRRLAALGVEEVKVVVGADNEAANRLYEGLGFRLERRLEVHRGAASNVWVVGCRSSSLSGSPSS